MRLISPFILLTAIVFSLQIQSVLMKWLVYDMPIHISIFGMLSTRIIAFQRVYERC